MCFHKLVDAGKRKLRNLQCSGQLSWFGGGGKEKNTGIIKGQTRLHWCCIPVQFCCSFFVWIGHKKRDTISSFKEVADSVRLDPWRAGNCPVCFG
jgi:hypothetical protein